MSRSSQSCLPCSWPFDKCACSDVHAKEIAKKDGIITMLKEDLDYKITLCDKMAKTLKKINKIVSARNDDGLDTNKIVEEVLSLWEQGKKV